MPIPNGIAIKTLRQAKGWSGVDFAHAAGISHGHLFNLENPERRKTASHETLTRIAGILGVPVDRITQADT